jgi:hypothetical protein
MAAPPPDGHVHTEWSWDTTVGSMEQTCARAVDLGLPSIAFTDHCDFTRWQLDPPPPTPPPGSRENDWLHHQRDGWLVPPPLDVDGYLATEYRTVLATLARSGQPLELNTVVPLPARIVRWWHDAAARRWPSAATPTSRPAWPGSSPAPLGWPRRPVSVPAGTRMTCGGALA